MSSPVSKLKCSASSFIQSLRPLAAERGVTRETFDRTLAGASYDAEVARLSRRQPEYGRPVGVYVNGIASAANIANGKRKAEEYAASGLFAFWTSRRRKSWSAS